jgi:hypothetical protein
MTARGAHGDGSAAETRTPVVAWGSGAFWCLLLAQGVVGGDEANIIITTACAFRAHTAGIARVARAVSMEQVSEVPPRSTHRAG